MLKGIAIILILPHTHKKIMTKKVTDKDGNKLYQ